jgi:hypothetical protein
MTTVDPDGLTRYGRCIEDAAILRRVAGEVDAVAARHRRALRKHELGFTSMQLIDAADALDGEAADIAREGS